MQLQSVLGTIQTQNNANYNIAQFDNSVGLSGKLSKFDYQVNFSNRHSENMSAVASDNEEENFEDNPFSKYNVYARVGYKISEKLKFYFYGNYDDFESSLKCPIGTTVLFLQIQGYDSGGTGVVWATNYELSQLDSTVANSYLVQAADTTAGYCIEACPLPLGSSRNYRIAGQNDDDNVLSCWINGWIYSR